MRFLIFICMLVACITCLYLIETLVVFMKLIGCNTSLFLPFQTLLHEMIHALLFVTQNNRDRDGHGPEFCKHMNRINQASGSKITVSPIKRAAMLS